MTALTELRLRNFRSYTEACLNGLASSFVVLTGPNGAGKTNILEAISLLSPGRGLRTADLGDLQNKSQSVPWVVSAKIETYYGPVHIGTGKDPEKNRRTVHIQGEVAKSQTELSEYCSCLWLTPQMDRLFIEASSARRKFLDRMVFSFDAGHAGRITRYENALAQRSRLLKDPALANPSWLDALEVQLAETGVAIAAARHDFTERLQIVCNRRPDASFPRADLAVKGYLEDRLESMSALELEKNFLGELKRLRADDAVLGGSSIGPHRSDFLVNYRLKQMPAQDCSTGEQKALLIGIILAHADLITAEKGSPPILLLDEVAAHLDPQRRKALYDLLGEIGGQVWMTGTEDEIFRGIPQTATIIEVKNSCFLSVKDAA